jgi:hypothetical protein
MRKMCPFVVAAALLAGLPSTAAACRPGWSVAQIIPDTPLRAVTLVPGTTEAWAVGSQRDEHGNWHPLALRIQGHRWTQVPVPEPVGENLSLNGVFARSSTDVWAIGHRRSEFGDGARPLVAHWNGSEWSITPGTRPRPQGGEERSVLLDIVASGPGSAWAVGFSESDAANPQVTTLVQSLHGRGASTAIAPSSSPANRRNRLHSIARVGGTRTFWAVGDWSDDHGAGGPLIEVYRHNPRDDDDDDDEGEDDDGHRRAGWTAVPAPNVPGGSLNSVAALAWDDVWAVGSSSSEDGSALTLHRTRRGWRRVSSPGSPVPGGYGRLNAVSAVSDRDVWAVGYLDGFRDIDSSGNLRGPLMQHWDGSSWSVVGTPVSDPTAVLYDVAMRRTGYGWSVGTGRLFSDGLLLRHCPS